MAADYVSLLVVNTPAYIMAGAALITVLRKLNEIHLTMNSRLDELVKASKAQGRQDERDAHSVTVLGVPAPGAPAVEP